MNSADIHLIYRKLHDFYGEVQTPLHHQTIEQLTIAVVLSAQTTDNQVNKITPELFSRYPDMESLSNADIAHLEKLVYSTGFYKNKAKNIKNLAIEVVKKFKGKIPNDFNELIKLPGIGRKTANVIMDCAFNQSVGVVVDTHVKRLSNRFGWTSSQNPNVVEKDLMKLLPKEIWKDITLYMIYHGRKFCTARQADCKNCFLNQDCPSAFNV
jgi:endonuclease-3